MSSPVATAIEELLRANGSFTSGDLAVRTGITRQALHRHLTRLLEEGALVREGQGRATRYLRAARARFDRRYPTAGLEEDAVRAEVEAWLGRNRAELSRAADAVLAYVLTEMVNNAVDHSGAATVDVRWSLIGERLEGVIADQGIGALERLRTGLGFDDHLHALQMLSLGKATTQPDRHTGEGIFFSSKMVERFELRANGLSWMVDAELGDQAVRRVPYVAGTEVRVTLERASELAPETVFRRYTNDYEFDTTRCVVRLFEHGVRFVSRSEAKRLTADLDRFREVILDFAGVDGVGQGFVDEIFRVWARSHPEVRLEPIRMNEAVTFMVRRGLGEPDLPRRARDGPG